MLALSPAYPRRIGRPSRAASMSARPSIRACSPADALRREAVTTLPVDANRRRRSWARWQARSRATIARRRAARRADAGQQRDGRDPPGRGGGRGSCKTHGGYLFCDAVQALGRIPVDIAALGVDFLDPLRAQDRRAAGRGRARAARRRRPPGAASDAAAGRSGDAAPGPRMWRRSPGFGVAARLARHHLEEARKARVAAGPAGGGDGWRSRPRSGSSDGGAERLPNTTLFVPAGTSRPRSR